jgi:hypothetical protein
MTERVRELECVGAVESALRRGKIAHVTVRAVRILDSLMVATLEGKRDLTRHCCDTTVPCDFCHLKADELLTT